VAAAGRLALTDVTYSGSTTADLLWPSAAGQPAQVDAVTPDTRLVTITAGGNDIGYIGTLSVSSMPAPLRALPSARSAVTAARDPATIDARFAGLRVSLTTLVAEIRSRAPQATIVLVDYLTILPPDDSPIRSRPDAATADWGRSIARRLSETFRAVADVERCEFLPVADASRDHHAWAVEPWTRRFQLSLGGAAPYHPNVAGMRAVATLLGERLGIHSA